MISRLRIAIIDSGVNPANPHVGGLAGGIGITPDGGEHPDYLDRLGHGTAVAAAIHEKAPGAALYAVKIFDDSLSAHLAALVRAIDWAAKRRMRLVNLSLGTANPAHEEALRAAVTRARAAGVLIVAAGEQDGIRWLPGSLEGVVPVELDWTCPRGECRRGSTGARPMVRASGFPRGIPGVPAERNLKGISFAVANATGLLAQALEGAPHEAFAEWLRDIERP